MPDTRKKLIKLLYEAPCESEHEGKPGSCPYRKFGRCGEVGRLDHCAVVHLGDHLIANGVTVQEWISVKDRLPEVMSRCKRYRSTYRKSSRVLCVCVQKDGKTMVKEGYCEWYNDYPEPNWKIPGTIDSVTHWMPLPEPPKGA